MRPSDSTDARLWDMLGAAREVTFFVRGRSFADFQRDLMLRRAVERSIEIVGEAARCVSEAFRHKHPHIPWDKIVLQRHRVVHDYVILRDDLLWDVATVHVPALIVALEPLVSDPTPAPSPEPPPSDSVPGS